MKKMIKNLSLIILGIVCISLIVIIIIQDLNNYLILTIPLILISIYCFMKASGRVSLFNLGWTESLKIDLVDKKLTLKRHGKTTIYSLSNIRKIKTNRYDDESKELIVFFNDGTQLDLSRHSSDPYVIRDLKAGIHAKKKIRIAD